MAGHFVSWVNAELGEIVIRELATIVVEGGGARDLERALERYADMSFAQTEQAYAALDRNDYSGLRDVIVPELEFDLGIDVSLRCQDDTTFGPLPSASPGMYRTLRFELDEPRVVEFQLFGGDDVRMDIIDVGAERLVGHIIDFHHPRPSGGIDHRVVRVSDRQRLAWLSAGTYLLYISQAGYGPSETILLASDLGPFNE